jgi:hypothetical protein
LLYVFIVLLCSCYKIVMRDVIRLLYDRADNTE